MRKLAFTAVLISVATSAGAAPVGIPGSEIAGLVSGAKVELDTPLGKTISVRFATGGRLSGEAGELASYLGAASDTGRWWIEGDRLCNKWLQWFEAEPQCLELKRSGQKIHWRNQAGTGGTATIVAGGAKQPPQNAKLAAANSSTRMGLAGPKPDADKSQKAGLAKAKQIEKQSLHRVANVSPRDVLNVRGGPSAEAPVVGTLEPETRGIALTGTCQMRWCPMSHGRVAGWVNAAFLEPEGAPLVRDRAIVSRARIGRDSPGASRTCLSAPARALLDRIESRFGPVQVISTCRLGATIAGTGRTSRHASGNAVDFDAGSRKGLIIEWLVANHKSGGTMTYPSMDHIHVDVGRHFVSLASRGERTNTRRGGGRRLADWSRNRMGLTR